jgi:hypothetical protein
VVNPDFGVDRILGQGVLQIGLTEVGNQLLGGSAAFDNERGGELGALGVRGGLAADSQKSGEEKRK